MVLLKLEGCCCPLGCRGLVARQCLQVGEVGQIVWDAQLWPSDLLLQLLQCQASHDADVSGPAPKNIHCHFGSIALIMMQARAGSEGQAASLPVVGDSGLLGGVGLLGGEGGVTVVVVTGVAAVEAVTGVAAAAKVTGVAAAVGVAGTAAEVVAAVMEPLCCTAAFVLAVPVVSEKVAETPAGQAALKI